MKRTADEASGGTADAVRSALGSMEKMELTDEQLDLVLPMEGFEIVAPASGQQQPQSTPAITRETVLQRQKDLSAQEVHAYFNSELGAFDSAFTQLQKMSIEEVEALQGIAEQISVGAGSEEAQQAGFEWSVKIGSFIA